MQQVKALQSGRNVTDASAVDIFSIFIRQLHIVHHFDSRFHRAPVRRIGNQKMLNNNQQKCIALPGGGFWNSSKFAYGTPFCLLRRV